MVLLRLLQQIDSLPGVKHLRVASGIRHDIALDSPDYAWALVRHYVGGQLKLAPEHCCDHVLELMRKPSFKVFEQFLTLFERESQRGGKEQYVVPYLLSAFPGCTDDDMRQLARWLRQRGWRPQQVQCFIPTPGTVATAMYAGGIDPAGKRITVARSDAARLCQHRILMPDGEPQGQRKKPCKPPARTGRGGNADSGSTRGARSHRRKKR